MARLALEIVEVPSVISDETDDTDEDDRDPNAAPLWFPIALAVNIANDRGSNCAVNRDRIASLLICFLGNRSGIVVIVIPRGAPVASRLFLGLDKILAGVWAVKFPCPPIKRERGRGMGLYPIRTNDPTLFLPVRFADESNEVFFPEDAPICLGPSSEREPDSEYEGESNDEGICEINHSDRSSIF
jgi:hypothetical protein